MKKLERMTNEELVQVARKNILPCATVDGRKANSPPSPRILLNRGALLWWRWGGRVQHCTLAGSSSYPGCGWSAICTFSRCSAASRLTRAFARVRCHRAQTGPDRPWHGARMLTRWPLARPLPPAAADCRRSLLLGLFCFVPLIIWFTVFQTQYGFWGSVGEALLIAVPRGYYGRSS